MDETDVTEPGGQPPEATNGGVRAGDGYSTLFEGPGFGTRTPRVVLGRREVPAVVSQRAYLRGALPPVYREREEDATFILAVLEALEQVLDPVVAVLDSLPAYLHPDCAPADMVDVLVAWLGGDLEGVREVRDPFRARERKALYHAAELSRRRGTVRGLELALHLHFPELAGTFRIEDSGGVRWRERPDKSEDETGDAGIPPGGFVVYCTE